MNPVDDQTDSPRGNMSNSPEQAINDFVEQVNKEFGVGPPTKTRACATGDAVVTIGAISEDHKPDGLFNSFIRTFRKYAKDKKGPIYWRQLPEFHESGAGDHLLSARLFIAD